MNYCDCDMSKTPSYQGNTIKIIIRLLSSFFIVPDIEFDAKVCMFVPFSGYSYCKYKFNTSFSFMCRIIFEYDDFYLKRSFYELYDIIYKKIKN